MGIQMDRLLGMLMSISEAAATLSASQQTIRRRLRAGVLTGHQEPTPQGYRWLVEVETGEDRRGPAPRSSEDQDMIALLRDQLAAKDLQISELHRLLAQAALSPAKASRRWWEVWK